MASWARWGLSLCAAAAVGAAGEAQAFSDNTVFTEDAIRGGGGGRFFTGSPVDGYGCDVCHQGGEPPQIQIAGLPLDGYVPGQTYEVVVWWQQPELRHSMHLEVIGRDGMAAGQLQRVEEAQVEPAGRCGSLADGKVASYALTPPGRQVLGVEPCGSASLRFFYTPPEATDVAFSISAVASDNDESPEGDGVFNARRVLRRQGESSGGGCEVGASGPSAPLAAALLALLWWQRRGRGRRAQE